MKSLAVTAPPVSRAMQTRILGFGRRFPFIYLRTLVLVIPIRFAKAKGVVFVSRSHSVNFMRTRYHNGIASQAQNTILVACRYKERRCIQIGLENNENARAFLLLN